jgi:TP901 family phage tail tape measure protein
MATNVSRKVAIIFEGDDRVSNVINGVSGNLDAFSSKISGVTQPLANLADQILLLEAAFGVLAGGAFALALKQSYEFETALVSMEKILGDQAYLIGEVKEEVLELSNRFGIAAVTVQEGTTNWKKAGFTVEETTGLMEESVNLMIAAAESELGLAEASEFMIAIMKGFKSEASDAGRIVDILNKVSNEYAVSVTQLGIGMSKLSPIAKQMGFSYEETAAILTPVIEVFRSGDEAATSMRTGLLKLVDDAAPVQAALRSLGVEQRDTNGHLKSGKEILFEVSKAFETAEETEKLFLAQQLVGQRQAAKMVLAFNDLNYIMEIHDVALNSTGSRLEEVKIRMQTFEKQLDRLKIGFQNLGIAVGDEFRLAAQGAVEGATEIEMALQGLVKEGAFDELFSYLRDLGDRLGVFFSDIAKVLPEAVSKLDFAPLLASLDSVGGEIGDIFDAIFGNIDLTTPGGLAAFLQKMIDGFTAFQNVVAGVLSGLEPFIKKAVELVNIFIEGGAESQKFKGEIVGVAKGVNTLLQAVPLLTGSLNLLSGAIGLLAFTRIPAMLGGLGQLGSISGGLISTLGTAGLVGVVGALSLGVGLFVGNLIKDIPIVKAFGEGLADIFLRISNLDKASTLYRETQAASTTAAGVQAVAIVQLAEALGELPSQQTTEVLVAGSPEYLAELKKIEEQVVKFPDLKSTTLTVAADEQSAKDAVKTMFITVTGESGDVFTIPVEVKADGASIEETKKKIDEIPNEKLLIARIDNQTELEVAKIMAQADTIQSAFEWNAKINIVEVEQHMETIRTLSDNLTTSFINTGDVISAMVGSLADLTGYEAFKVLSYIEAESARREKLLVAQLALTAAEVKWLEAKTASVDRGDAAISIQMEGIYPELELIMWKVMERVQLQVNNEGLDLLL